MSLERRLYSSAWHYWANRVLFPLKMLVPQPLVARIPGLTTNEDIRIGLALALTRGRLFDIGCGNNRLVRTYLERGGAGTGVDVYPWEGADAVFEDTAHLPYESGSADTVTFVACLNHIPNREDVLREAHRILSDGGRLLVTNLRPFISRIWHGWAFWDADQHQRGMEDGEVFGFSREGIHELLETAGFRITEHLRFSWGLNELYVCDKVCDSPDRGAAARTSGTSSETAF